MSGWASRIQKEDFDPSKDEETFAKPTNETPTYKNKIDDFMPVQPRRGANTRTMKFNQHKQTPEEIALEKAHREAEKAARRKHSGEFTQVKSKKKQQRRNMGSPKKENAGPTHELANAYEALATKGSGRKQKKTEDAPIDESNMDRLLAPKKKEKKKKSASKQTKKNKNKNKGKRMPAGSPQMKPTPSPSATPDPSSPKKSKKKKDKKTKTKSAKKRVAKGGTCSGVVGVFRSVFTLIFWIVILWIPLHFRKKIPFSHPALAPVTETLDFVVPAVENGLLTIVDLVGGTKFAKPSPKPTPDPISRLDTDLDSDGESEREL